MGRTEVPLPKAPVGLETAWAGPFPSLAPCPVLDGAETDVSCSQDACRQISRRGKREEGGGLGQRLCPTLLIARIPGVMLVRLQDVQDYPRAEPGCWALESVTGVHCFLSEKTSGAAKPRVASWVPNRPELIIAPVHSQSWDPRCSPPPEHLSSRAGSARHPER